VTRTLDLRFTKTMDYHFSTFTPVRVELKSCHFASVFGQFVFYGFCMISRVKAECITVCIPRGHQYDRSAIRHQRLEGMARDQSLWALRLSFCFAV